ncbi:MAG: DNA-3-methyladenine glycosylase 2 [Casimicrobiaceae bacterium]
MSLDATGCYRALVAHDPRFDGRFFVGVSSTGIYCRPVCTARTPRRENCRFFPSAAAAEVAGFRPCLRCRPELAPGHASVDSSARLAHAAIGCIEDGVLEAGGLEALAARLGVTSRHVRRVFASVLGVSPVAFAQTHRLLLAKRLLTDTALPVTEIAYASGFASVRRFNTLFRARYRLAPGVLRRHASTLSPAAPLTFELAYRPPYDWAGMQGFLAARAIEGVESVSPQRYARTLQVRHAGALHRGWVVVAPVARRPALRVEIPASLARAMGSVLGRVRHAFDLGCDPIAIAAALGPLADDAPGVRVPGTMDGFELAVRAVVGQQISVRGARTLLARLVRACGEARPSPDAALQWLFPTPERVLGCGLPALRDLGILPARARTLLALAEAVVAGTVALDPRADVVRNVATLRAIPGIGPWTADIIAMRALGWPDAFPSGDIVLQRVLGATTSRHAEQLSRQWQPWRSYAVMHLWRQA